MVCRVLHRSYYNNDFLFWRPAVSTEHIDGDRPTYRSYYPDSDKPQLGLRESLTKLLNDCQFANPFVDLERDVGLLIQVLASFYPRPQELRPNCQLQVLESPFYRNKAAGALVLPGL